MKIKTIRIRIDENSNEFDLDDFLLLENYTVRNTFGSIINDESGSYWEILIFYDLQSNQITDRGIKSELYEELNIWVKKKAKDVGVTAEEIEEKSKVYEFAKDYFNYTSKADFLIHRNFGPKRFKDYGREIMEIFRKYQ